VGVRLPFLLVSSLLGSQIASAVCVTDVASFQAALNAANGSTTAVTIKVARGTYDLSAGRLSFESYLSNQAQVSVSGGYDHDCTGQIKNPALTILDGGGHSALLRLQSPAGLSVRYLTLQNGSSTDEGTALQVYSSATIIVDYNIIRNNSTSTYNMIVGGINFATGNIHVDGNLLVGNTASGANAAGSVYTTGSGNTYVTNNTVVGNSGDPASCARLQIGISGPGTGTAYASNNIFWHNTLCGVYVSGVVLTNNDYGALGGTADPTSSGNVNVSPGFNPGAYSLAADSPLLGKAELAPPGGLPTIDIEGNPRSYDKLVDFGAYERGNFVFADGFDD